MPSPTPSATPTTLVGGRGFAEAPRWHQGRLWCSDFFQAQVDLRVMEHRGVVEEIPTGERGSLACMRVVAPHAGRP